MSLVSKIVMFGRTLIDLTGDTIVASHVLSGDTFHDKSGAKLTGTMTNNGNVAPSGLNAGESYTIPAGYHAGSGKVTTNSLSSQTSANAVATTMLTNYTAWVNGKKITGTMTNQGSKKASLNGGESYTIPQGFHDGTGKVTANSLSSQTVADAIAADIAKNKTAWVNGIKLTGSVTESGSFTAGVGLSDISVGSAQSSYTTFNGTMVSKTIIQSNGVIKLMAQNSVLSSAIGLTAAKIGTGNTILGITGTFTGGVTTTTLTKTLTLTDGTFTHNLNTIFPGNASTSGRMLLVETAQRYYNSSGSSIVTAYDAFYAFNFAGYFFGGATRIGSSNTYTIQQALALTTPSTITTAAYGSSLHPAKGSPVPSTSSSAVIPTSMVLSKFNQYPTGSTSVAAASSDVTTTVKVITLV